MNKLRVRFATILVVDEAFYREIRGRRVSFDGVLLFPHDERLQVEVSVRTFLVGRAYREGVVYWVFLKNIFGKGVVVSNLGGLTKRFEQ